jgi:ABC-type branched-subunit amino acid transport system ATPase component
MMNVSMKQNTNKTGISRAFNIFQVHQYFTVLQAVLFY